MPQTPSPGRGLPAPALADIADGPDAVDDLRLALDRVASISGGALASRPAANNTVGTAIGNPFSFYWASDTNQLFLSFGGSWIDLSGASGPQIPIGAALEYGGNGDPADTRFLLEDGRALARTGQYATLFATLGTTYGAGDGTTTFNIPDSRGRVTVGPDNMGTSAGAAGRLPNSPNGRGNVGGEEKHTLTSGESGVNSNGVAASAGAHTHGVSVDATQLADASVGALMAAGGIAESSGPAPAYANGSLPAPTYIRGTLLAVASNHAHTASASTSGAHTHTLTGRTADSGHNNLQPYVVKNKIIRVR